jgi:hypothetical protein
MLNSIIEHLTCETEKHLKKKHVKERIDKVLTFVLRKFYPFLYTILAILVLMFAMNCFQFFYYVKTFENFKNLYKNTTDFRQPTM